jgi:phosphoribosyl 1,2-cyclic phosphodiesterase
MALGLGFPDMRVAVLGSGSAGNAVVVESDSRRLLVDAGFSCRELERRLDVAGIDASGFDGILLTHEHGDHVRGADVFSRRYGVPVFATKGTFASARLGKGEQERVVIRSGQTQRAGSFQIVPFRIPHDASDPVGYVVEDMWGRRVGVVSDIGTCSRLAWGRLKDLDMLVLEFNHDLKMLRDGPYPWHLKQRIAGRFGHLSNTDAAEGMRELISDRLQWVVLYHLSETNNMPALAVEAVTAALEREACSARLCVTTQEAPTEWMPVGVRGEPAAKDETVLDHASG